MCFCQLIFIKHLLKDLKTYSRSVMLQILEKLGLQLWTFWKRKKITPGIVCKLSVQEFEAVGISNGAEMIKIRIECVQFGRFPPNRIKGNVGPPMFDIPKSTICLKNNFEISDIATLLLVSERTIYRRMGWVKVTFSNLMKTTSKDKLVKYKISSLWWKFAETNVAFKKYSNSEMETQRLYSSNQADFIGAFIMSKVQTTYGT